MPGPWCVSNFGRSTHARASTKGEPCRPRSWGLWQPFNYMIFSHNLRDTYPKLQISGKHDDQPWHFGVPHCKNTRIIVFLADFYCLMGGNASWHCVPGFCIT